MNNIIKALFIKKVTIAKWELNLFGVVMISIGLLAGSYLTAKDVIPKMFASTQSSIAYDTDTDFNKGTLSSTSVSGTGSPAVVQLAGSSGPSNTQYYEAITVDNTGNTNALTNYQVSFTTNTATLVTSGHMRTDCGDIRIVDADKTTVLNYWVETGCNTSSTKIWVEIPSVSASSSKTIYMYYGNNALTTQSSTTNTFIDDISGVKGAWNMDESSGATVNDSSGSLNNGTSTGTTITSGKFNNGLNFTVNTTNIITFPNTNLGGNHTVSAWVKFPIPLSGNWRTLFANNGGNYHYILVRAGANTLGTYDAGWYSCGYDVSTVANGWHQLTAVGSGSSTVFYLDGASICISPNNIVNQNVGAIGNYVSGGTQSIGTTIDQARIYNVALSTAQVSELYNNYGYTTTNDSGHELVRKYSSPEPSATVGSETTALAFSGAFESPSNSNVIDTIWNGGWGDGSTGSSTAFSATVGSLNSNQTLAFQMRTAATTTALTSASYVTLGTANSGTTFTQTKAQLDALGLGTGTNRYIQVKVTFTQTTGTSPTLDNFTIYYAKDNTAPETNATSPLMSASNGGISIASSGWTNSATPYFTWTAGSDSQSGIKGYCLYLGTDNTVVPSTGSPGRLTSANSPVSTTGTSCGGGAGFIVSSSSVDLSTSGYIGTALTSSNSLYYLGVAAVDTAGNVDSAFTFFPFYYDGTAPTNVAYTSCAGGNFSNVTDMNFSWPASGSSASSDSNSGMLGWQYQINSSTGTWQGTTHNSTFNLDYIPATASAYTLVSSRDSSAIVSGANIIYFRSVDASGNLSSSSTYRTCSLSYGGAAPGFPGDGTITVTPGTATTNSFALSWPAATATTGQTVAHYYYMINSAPPSSLSTLQGNAGTYIDNGTSISLSATALANVVKGKNTVYVVAIDDAGTPNYSPSNDITGTFTLNSTNPDPVANLVSSDSSIKTSSTWNVSLTWTAGTYQGAGNLTYLIYRSSDDVTFSKVGSTASLFYVDNTPLSQKYYYYVVTQDGASAKSSNSTTVSITPTGKYTSAPSLQSGPTVSGITTQQATIAWSTDRNGDSKVSYGTSSNSYLTTQPYVSTQITSHTVTLTNLTPGTTYYYKVSWTDTDGNTGFSSESSFSTSPPPTASGVKATGISLSSAYISFTLSNATQATVQYGTSTAYGGSQTIATSTNQSTYSVPLTNLLDGTIYHYRVVMQDSSGVQYNSDDYTDLVTLPRPKISNITISQVVGTAQPTVLIDWNTNTDISSILTYYPLGNAGAARDKVEVALIHGQHQMLIAGLDPKTTYQLLVKGRDKVGNEAVSDIQTFTTVTDTRPPYASDLAIQGSTASSVSGGGQSNATQMVVTWNTDKLATSQVEYGEGTGSNYSQKTQEDSNYTFNHLVIISGLTPSKVYHLRAVSVDKYNNIGNSIDTVTITPKATDNALNLVVNNLQQAFGFLGGIGSGGQ